MWIKRLTLILDESNIGIHDNTDLSIFKLISKNYSSLAFDLKNDVLYSTGAYSRFIYSNDKNYELARELSNAVKDMNLIVGDYQGYAIACSYISKCNNELYSKSKDLKLFEEAFYFNEEVYYELENGYSLIKGKVNIYDAVSQFIVLANWIELVSMNNKLNEKMRKCISNAINDFILIFADENGEVSIAEKNYLEDYTNKFKKFSESTISDEIDELKPIFEKVKFKE